MCRGHAQYPAFAPPDPLLFSWLFRRGSWAFWSFCILLPIICPSCTCTQLFLVPYSVFAFCCLRRCLSRCKHCSKGSQVPACLRSSCHQITRFTYWRLSIRSRSPAEAIPTCPGLSLPLPPKTSPPLPLSHSLPPLCS